MELHAITVVNQKCEGEEKMERGMAFIGSAFSIGLDFAGTCHTPGPRWARFAKDAGGLSKVPKNGELD